MNVSPFWYRPWSHAHACLVAGTLFAVLLALQILHPAATVHMPGVPWNWIVAVLPALAGLVSGRIWASRATIVFLGGPALAIAGLVALAAASWPLAVYPVGALAPAWLHSIGLGDPLAAPTFACALMIVVLNLAVALGRRWSAAVEASAAGRIRFSMLHLGLLITLVGGSASQGGLIRARFTLEEGAVPGVVAQSDDGSRIVLPFALALDDFILDRFPPMLVLADVAGGLQRGEALLGPGVEDRIRDLTIHVTTFLPAAAAVGGKAVPFLDPSANPAAEITVRDAMGTTLAAGWVHPGGLLGPPLGLALPDGRKLHLEAPRPQRFLAKVRALSPGGQRQAAEITVNRPLRRDGWAVYILSYDEALGPASKTAVFEVVEDRALPVVYLGLILVLVGVLWQLWAPRVRP